jgi:short-subunit dehydrogenase
LTRRLCLITGASAGIGAAFARIYASHGYDVALTARRTDRLEKLADEISLRSGVETLTITADLAEAGAVDHILADLEAHGRHVDALVNNAGYGLPGAYAATTWADQQALLRVLVEAPAELTHKVLPGMIDRRFGRILNVSSMAAYAAGTPTAALYGPTKALMLRFSQSLHLEAYGTGVHVSALCPGFTYSEFHDVAGTRDQLAARTPAWLWMGADEVAAAGYEAAEANRPVCIPGAPNLILHALAKILPDEWVMTAMRAGLARRFGR